jgi:hypothetical protein
MSLGPMQSETGTERKSFGELLRQLLSDSTILMRDEMELFKQEMNGKVKILRSGFLAIVIGAMITQIALLVLCAAAVIWLADSIGLSMSAFVIGAGLALIGAAVALFGLQQLKQTNLEPEKTIQTLKASKEWLKELS